jgi:Ca-activated chloride channel homolog
VLLAELSRTGNGSHRFAETVDEAVAAIADEVDGLLAKTVQNTEIRLLPSPAVLSYGVYGTLPTWEGPDGSLVVGLGDLFAGELRKVLLRINIPGMAALGLHQVTEMQIRYVALPELAEHTLTVPISVNVVPADLAAGRVPDPRVRVEQLVQEAQTAKAEASSRLRRGSRGSAASLLRSTARELRDNQELLGALEADLEQILIAEAEEIDELAVSAEQESAAISAKKSMLFFSQKSRGRTNPRP